MKTTEEIINEYAFETYNDFTDDAACIKIELKDAIKIMKIYANQKLDEAYEIQGHEHDRKSILSLKDDI